MWLGFDQTVAEQHNGDVDDVVVVERLVESIERNESN